MNLDLERAVLKLQESEAKLGAYTLQNRKYPVTLINAWWAATPGTLRVTTDFSTGRLCIDVRVINTWH